MKVGLLSFTNNGSVNSSPPDLRGLSSGETTCVGYTNGDYVNQVNITDFFEDFDGYLDPNKWRIGKRQWGCIDSACSAPANGGVIPENVHLERSPDGQSYLRLEAHGNLYTGNIFGVDKQGKRRRDSTVIQTQSK